MKILHNNIFVLLLVALGLFVSCDKESIPIDPEPPEIPGRPGTPEPKRNRTVIAYIVSDNNLSKYVNNDINEMELGWDSKIDGNMVVYTYPIASKAGDDEPKLLLIKSDDDTDVINSRVLKIYSRDQHPNDPEVMKLIIADAMRLAPADSYGMVFWSHGSGWLPGGLSLKSAMPSIGDPFWAGSKLEGLATTDSQTDKTIGYSFGDGSYTYGKASMEIDKMAEALPADVIFDFILFDACHMACVEVAWELRDNTTYLIAAVAETLAHGFPYDKIIEPMFKSGDADVVKIAEAFFNHYNAMSGNMQTATVSVTKSDALPALATAVKNLCANRPTVLHYGQNFGRGGYSDTFYDLGDFVSNTWKSDPDKVSLFEAVLSDAVIYEAATPMVLGIIDIKAHSGLSCYIPRASEPLSLTAYKNRFGWSEASGMGSLLQ